MIYVIRAGETETVKIGFTLSHETLKTRINNLSIGCPIHLSVEGTIPGSKKKERCLHHFCAKRHVRGEWFRLSKDEVSRMLAKYRAWSPLKDGIGKVPRL